MPESWNVWNQNQTLDTNSSLGSLPYTTFWGLFQILFDIVSAGIHLCIFDVTYALFRFGHMQQDPLAGIVLSCRIEMVDLKAIDYSVQALRIRPSEFIYLFIFISFIIFPSPSHSSHMFSGDLRNSSEADSNCQLHIKA